MAEVGAMAYHPWEFIEEEMQARGWSRDDLAARMPGEFDVMRLTIDLIEHAASEKITNIKFDGSTSELLGTAFGVSPQLFSNLYICWLKTQPPTV